MKNFDLDAAKRGAAVCTRNGKPVRIICWDMKWESGKMGDRIVYLADYNGDEHLSSCCINGAYHGKIKDSLDLMMRDDDYLEKLERGEYQSGQIRPLYENPSNSMGLTRREWFAGMAIGAVTNVLIAPNDEVIARYAVGIADALIEELEKTEK